MQHNNKKPETRTAKYFVEGTIRMTAKGMGFVFIEGEDDQIYIDPSSLGLSLHGDRVRVAVYTEPANGRAAAGGVIEVLERAKTTFVGVLEKKGSVSFLKPQNAKIHVDFFIPPHEADKAESGQKVLIELVRWDDPEKRPEGKIISVIGWPGDNDTEMKSIVLDKGLGLDFLPEVKAEAVAVKDAAPARIAEEAPKRRDMRGVSTFTIDPADAKDFDDALSIETLENGDIQIGVHIADVTAFVKPGSALDKSAIERGTSIYLVDRTIPMLPDELSNNICSLMPNVDRLTFSGIFTFDKSVLNADSSPTIKDIWFGETIIHSDKRFSYEDAQEVLDKEEGDYITELNTLNTIAYKLRADKFEAGAIVLEQDEVKFVLDEFGKPIEVIKKERGDTHKLVEDFMLLANKKAAKYGYEEAKKHKSGFIYRIHPNPEMDRLEQLADLLKSVGYDLPLTQEGVQSKDLNSILKAAEGTVEENLIQTAIVRSMAKAIYSTVNVGHFGLAFDYYTHFTSPIRRYPDMMVHRLMKFYLAGKTIPDEIMSQYTTLATQASDQERAASQAERDSIKYKYVEYMTEHIGKTYQGVISGVTAWGMYIQEKETLAEGMVALKNMTDDYYEYDEKKLAITGQKNKKQYRLGDTVSIQVKGADVEKQTIDYILVED